MLHVYSNGWSGNSLIDSSTSEPQLDIHHTWISYIYIHINYNWLVDECICGWFWVQIFFEMTRDFTPLHLAQPSSCHHQFRSLQEFGPRLSQGTEIGGAISHGACVLFEAMNKTNVPTCLDQGPCPIPRSNKAANLQQTSRTNWGTWLSSGYSKIYPENHWMLKNTQDLFRMSLFVSWHQCSRSPWHAAEGTLRVWPFLWDGAGSCGEHGISDCQYHGGAQWWTNYPLVN